MTRGPAAAVPGAGGDAGGSGVVGEVDGGVLVLRATTGTCEAGAVMVTVGAGCAIGAAGAPGGWPPICPASHHAAVTMAATPASALASIARSFRINVRCLS